MASGRSGWRRGTRPPGRSSSRRPAGASERSPVQNSAMARQLLATKSIAELHEQESSGNQLRRALTATQLTLLGIGGIIGTGIFVLTGVAAATNAGPALPLSFIVAGLGCTFAGLCYAEFAAMIPVSGSAYSYSYATLGEGIAWFIGWNLVLEYLFAVATVSVGWSGYAVSLLEQLHIHIPPALANAPLDKGEDALHWVRTGAIINVPAVLTGMVSYKELNVAAPVALALDKYPGLRWLGIPVKLGAVAGMTSVMLVMTIAQARIFFAMARDGLLPSWFGRVHPRFRTPSTGTVVTGVFAALIGGVFPVGILGHMV